MSRPIITALGLLLCVATARGGENGKSSHWAFRPIARPAIPSVRNADGIESPIDAFILEKLEAAGMEPALPTDKRTLIRRAMYDLVGLPPTPAEVAGFLADESPAAFASVVDRLLASPHYGERWGRHWLDVARYANTKGDTGAADPVSPFAFTYRDYVVRAFNDDLPFDRFLIEQIAGDRLGLGENSPALAALGFITVGRRFLNNNHDTIDDRIDVVTRGTMALTVSCARCHDHKYDPIPTRDYYSLYGVFASSQEPEPLPVVGQADAAAQAEYEKQQRQIQSKLQDFTRKQEAGLLEQHRKLTAEYLLASRTPPETDRKDAAGTAFPDAKVQRVGGPRWRKALEKLNKETDPVFAAWFAYAALPEEGFADRAKELSAKIASNSLPHPVNPLVAQTFAGEPPASIAEVAQRYGALLAAAIPSPEASPRTDDQKPAETPDAARDALRRLMIGPDAPGDLPQGLIHQVFSPMVRMQMQEIHSELTRLDSQHPGAPLRAMVLYDQPHPQNSRVFLRGNPNNPGDEVPRQFLEVLAGASRQPFSQGSGRLELARAIASRDNPLTARVIVNRVWQHHFGAGLVATPDDFGTRSEPPSHPELLDYLASRLMDDGWSLKKLHRLLMVSRVYRQSSDDELRYENKDSENRLISKMNRRRLDFESLRDTLLAAAGNLDRTLGGRAVEIVPQPKVAPEGAFRSPPGDQPATRRRAVYAFVDRQNLPGLLRAFDFADPDTITGRRFHTTVPQQALFFLNNPFVMQQACVLVEQPEFQRLNSAPEKLAHLYQRIFQRHPSAAELELAAKFIDAEQAAPAALPQADPASQSRGSKSKPRPLTAWERLAHALLMSDELMFVD